MQANVPEDCLPDEERQPDLFRALPELHYQETLNAAVEMVDRHVEEGRGDKPAVVFEGETITYEDLRVRVDRAANALVDLGVEPGDRVFVRFPNRPEYGEPDTARDDLVMIAYTSGTTGKPKGTVHTHRQMMAICDGYARYCLAPEPSDVFTSNAPIAFTFGYGFGVASSTRTVVAPNRRGNATSKP